MSKLNDLAVRFTGYVDGKPETIVRGKVTGWKRHADNCTEIFMEGGESETVRANEDQVAYALDFEVRNKP